MSAAREFAIEAHGRQVDRARRPYIEHLDRVAQVVEIMTDRDALTLVNIAYLHDVLEDTEVTYRQLEAAFGRSVAEGVQTLTRVEEDTYEKDTYLDYVRRVARTDMRIVKLADVMEHLAMRPDGYELGGDARKRYLKALNVLAFEGPTSC